MPEGSRGHPAPVSIVMARHDGKPLAEIAAEHGMTLAQLRHVLEEHSRYCFGRVEPSMVEPR